MIKKVLKKIRVALAKPMLSIRQRNSLSLTQTLNESEDTVFTAVHLDYLQTRTRNSWLKVILATSLGVTALVLFVQKLAWLQPLELNVYDQMIRLRPSESPDSRILLVTITEQDLQKNQQATISDKTINQLLQKLESYQPRVIGLSIFRDIPLGLDHQQLMDNLRQQNNIIGICSFGSQNNPEIPPPENLPINRTGFSDFVMDKDGITRSVILYIAPNTKKCSTRFSFASQLAISYLKNQGIASPSKLINNNFYLGKTLFERLKKNSAGYENKDARGYQILLNYRYPKVAQEVSLTKMLNTELDPKLVKDRLVIVGYTSSAIANSSFINSPNGLIPGVELQAQTTSQLISTVLDRRPLIWYLPEWADILWICLWSVLGGILAWRSRHPLILFILLATSIGVLLSISFILFLQAGWVIVIAPSLALILSRLVLSSYISYRNQQETNLMLVEVEKQQQAIVQLNTLLKNTGIQDQHHHITAEIDSSEKVTGEFLLSSRYKIIQVLGSGGFGCTYLAEDTQRPGHPTCVVKQLMPARRDPKFLQVARRLFSTEAEILQVLGKHHQIPELLAYFEDNQEFYLVQEYIQGHILSDELPPKKPVQNESFVIDMLKGVLEALAFVHEYRVIHRDLKPSNIIRRDQDNQIVLIDFGAVKLMRPPSTEETELSTVAIGTRGYAPPEQLAGHPRLSSDIYALGMIAIQALTGNNPQNLRINSETGTVLWRQSVQVSDEFATILDKMVRYYFSDRYQSATEVLQELNKLQ